MKKTVKEVKKVGKNYITLAKSPVYKQKAQVVRYNGDDVFRSKNKSRAKDFFDKLKK